MNHFDRDRRTLFGGYGRSHAPGERRMKMQAPQAPSGGGSELQQLLQYMIQQNEQHSSDMKQVRGGLDNLSKAVRVSPQTHRALDKSTRPTQTTAPVWTPVDGMPKPNGRMYPYGQFNVRYTDQFPGMVFDNSLVWISGKTTDGTERFALVNRAYLEEGCVIVPATTDRPHIMIRDKTTNEMRPVPLPRPQAGEAILGGIRPSNTKIEAEVEYIDADGNKTRKKEQITPLPGYFTSTLTGKDIIPFIDMDRFIRYNKNEYQQYLNKDGYIITMDDQGNLQLKDNDTPVTTVHVRNRLPNGDWNPDESQWRFYADAKFEKELPIRPKYRLVKKNNDPKEYPEIIFERNQYNTVMAINNEPLVFDTQKNITTAPQDPRDRLEYLYPSFRRIEHYETLNHIRDLMPANELAAERARYNTMPSRYTSFDQEGGYLDREVRGRLLPKPVFEINIRDNPGVQLQAQGSAVRRYITDPDFEPIVVEDGLWKHDTQATFDPRVETINQQMRRGFYYADAFSQNDKKISRLRMRNLNVEDPDHVEYANFAKPTGRGGRDEGETGRVSAYHVIEADGTDRRITPGRLYNRPEDGQLCLLVESPDFIYQGNNRVLWEVEMERDDKGRLRPIMEKTIPKFGDYINSSLFDWHPQKELQMRGGPQNSGASDPYKGRIAFSYAIDPTSFQIMQNVQDAHGWMDMSVVRPTESQYDGQGAPFHRDAMYGVITNVADDHSKLLFHGKNTDDFVTVRGVYAMGVGTTIRKDAYERIMHGVRETLGLGNDEFQKGTSKSIHYDHMLQTKYVAPAATLVSGLTTAAVIGGNLAAIAVGALTGGIAVSGVAALCYYHYIYDQSDRRKKWHTEEILEKNYAPKFIYEGKEDHKQFLAGLRNDIKLWFWDGVGMEQYFTRGGFKAQRDVDNDFWKWGAISAVTAGLTGIPLTMAALTSNTFGVSAVVVDALSSYAATNYIAGTLVSAAELGLSTSAASAATAATLTTVGLAAAGGLAVLGVGLAAVAAYDAVLSKMITYNRDNAMSYSYTDAVVKEYHTGEHTEATMGFDYVRQSFHNLIKRALGETPPTQDAMRSWIDNNTSTFERYR